jgi:hypothetical protein
LQLRGTPEQVAGADALHLRSKGGLGQ